MIFWKASAHAAASKTLCFIGQQDHFRCLLAKRDKRLIGGRRKPTIHCCNARETDNDNIGVTVFAGKRSNLFATKNKLTAPR